MSKDQKAAPTIRVELDGPIPVYRQVTEQIRTHIVQGDLAAGGELPSVRALAASLGVHFNTVAEAYRTLAEEGWLTVERGRGARVADRGVIKSPTKTAGKRQSERLRHLIAELRGNGFTAEWIQQEIDAALMGIGAKR